MTVPAKLKDIIEGLEFLTEEGSSYLTLQRHLQNMLFYHKGLRGRKTPLPFVACARKVAILCRKIWSAHESDVVGLNTTTGEVVYVTTEELRAAEEEQPLEDFPEGSMTRFVSRGTL
jgi:hypothetical protein